ncbi:MAG: tRNA pseudouridine(38-40) synthase TruA [Candidatus Dormibacteraceae bacterium]
MLVRLLLEYDGEDFAGWQTQRGRQRTVQGELAQALAELPGTWGSLQGAGRTDAGAHAEAQVASLTYQGPLPLGRLRAAINAHLPADVAVLSAEEAPPGFHARFSAIARHYRYRYLDRPARPVLGRGRCWWLARRLDEDAMAGGLPALVGRHDWTTYCVAGPRSGRGGEDNVRELFAASVERRGPFLDLDLVGRGFLRGQVRGIAGALAEVGLRRRSATWPGELLRARDRRQAPRTAPACGLTLVGVRYPGTG